MLCLASQAQKDTTAYGITWSWSAKQSHNGCYYARLTARSKVNKTLVIYSENSKTRAVNITDTLTEVVQSPKTCGDVKEYTKTRGAFRFAVGKSVYTCKFISIDKYGARVTIERLTGQKRDTKSYEVLIAFKVE